MATLGSLSVVFSADLSEFRAGIDEVNAGIAAMEGRRAEVSVAFSSTGYEEVVSQLESLDNLAPGPINVQINSSGIDELLESSEETKSRVDSLAASLVDLAADASGLSDIDFTINLPDLSNREITNPPPPVPIQADTAPARSAVDEFADFVEDSSKDSSFDVDAGEFPEEAESATDAVKALTEALKEAFFLADDGTIAAETGFNDLAEAIKQVLAVSREIRDGLEGSLESARATTDNVIAAINAGDFDQFVSAVGQAGDSAGTLQLSLEALVSRGLFALRGALTDLADQAGGFRNIMAAVRGEAGASGLLFSALGKSIVGLSVNLASYVAIVSAVDLATRDLSETSRGYLLALARVVGVQAALSAGNAAASASSNVLAKATTSSATAFETLSLSMTEAANTTVRIAQNARQLAQDLARVSFAFEFIGEASQQDTTITALADIAARAALITVSMGAASGAVSAYVEDLDVLDGALQGAKNSFTDFKQSFPQIALFAALSRVIAGLAQQLRSIAREIEVIDDLAFEFGVATAEAQKLKAAADAAGVSVNALSRAQQTFSQNVSKIRIGEFALPETQDAKSGFDRLGISLDQLKTKSPEELFRLTAQRLLQVEDAVDRTGIAVDIFGNRFGSLIPALRNIEDVESELERLNIVSSEFEINALLEVDRSFDRLAISSSKFSQSFMLGFAGLQEAVNDFLADSLGGLSSSLSLLGRAFNDFSKPISAIITISGRVANIFFRISGAIINSLLPAFAIFPNFAALVEVLEEAILRLLEPLERVATVLETVSQVIYDTLSPAIENVSELLNGEMLPAILELATYFAAAIAITAAFNVALGGLSAIGINLGGAFLALGTNIVKGLVTIGPALIKGILPAFRAITTGFINLAITATQNLILISLRATAAGASMLLGFAQPAIAAIATYITGISSAAAATVASSVIMAAGWVVATGGLILLVGLIVGIVARFDELSEYLANWRENLGSLFTFEGFGNAIAGIKDTVVAGFSFAFDKATDLAATAARGMAKAFMDIEYPEPIDPAAASADELVASRKANLEADAEAARQLATAFNQTKVAYASMFGGTATQMELPEAPEEDYDRLANVINQTDSRLRELTFNAAAFGESGQEAAEDIRVRWIKLREEFSLGEKTEQEFEAEARKLQETLEENIDLASVISAEEVRKLFSDLQTDIARARTAIRDLTADTEVVDSFGNVQLFPASDEIKAQAEQFRAEYEAELRNIAERAAAGEFGEGQEGRDNIADARAEAERKFKRNQDALSRDTSFANSIRKQLEEAFLTPLQKYERRLSQIRNNQSLTPEERRQAEANLRRETAESTFGRGRARELQDRRELVQFLPMERRASALRSIADDRRQAIGITGSAGQERQLGIDKINDAFGTTGKTLAQIRATLNPSDFREYQRALKENEVAARASVGIERTSAEALAESRRRLTQALNEGVVTQPEFDRKMQAEKDSLLQSVGVALRPAQEYERIADRIRLNSDEMSPEELADAYKNAREDLLSSLGVTKTPMQEFADAMRNLAEAAEKGQLSFEEYAKAQQNALSDMMKELGILEDPLVELGNKLSRLVRMLGREMPQIPVKVVDTVTGEITTVFRDAFTAEDIQDAIQKALDEALPGSRDSRPLEDFRRDMRTLDRFQFGESQQEIAEKADFARRAGLQSPIDADAAQKKVQDRINEINAEADDAIAEARRNFAGDDRKNAIARIEEDAQKKIDEARSMAGPLAKRLYEINQEAEQKKEDLPSELEGKAREDAIKRIDEEAARKRGEAKEVAGMTGPQRSEYFQNLFKSDAQLGIESIYDKARKEGRNLTPEERMQVQEFQGQELDNRERRLAVAAELQESLKPALDQLKPDRRGVEGSDVRSKGGVDTFFRILRGRDNPSLKAQLDTARNTRLLVEAANNPETAPIIAQLGAY